MAATIDRHDEATVRRRASRRNATPRGVVADLPREVSALAAAPRGAKQARHSGSVKQSPRLAVSLTWCVLGIAVTVLAGCSSVASARELRRRHTAALLKGDVLEAVRLGRARVRQAPWSWAAHYDFACTLARSGDREAAVAELRIAIAAGFDSPAFMSKDEDLSALRSKPEFEELRHLAAAVGRDGISVPGLRTELRLDLPSPLRLRLPLTGRARLAIWLHPYGSTSNADIERLAPLLAERGFGLAVPVRPGLGWTDDELRAVLDESVPRLADLVETERPLLIGMSAGSQAALDAWARFPTRFLGVIASASSPRVEQAALPAGGAPLYVLNGALDPATAEWQRALRIWQGGGRTVFLEVLPDLGHEFVLDEGSLGRALEAVRGDRGLELER